MELKEVNKVVVELNDIDFEVLMGTRTLLLRLTEKLQPNEVLSCGTDVVLTQAMLSAALSTIHNLIFVEEITEREE